MKSFAIKVASPYGTENIKGTLVVPNYTEKLPELSNIFGTEFIGSYFAKLRIAHENMGQARRSLIRQAKSQVETLFPAGELWVKTETGTEPTEKFRQEFTRCFTALDSSTVELPLAPPSSGPTKAEESWLTEVRSKPEELVKLKKVGKALGLVLSTEPTDEELLAIRREIL